MSSEEEESIGAGRKPQPTPARWVPVSGAGGRSEGALSTKHEVRFGGAGVSVVATSVAWRQAHLQSPQPKYIKRVNSKKNPKTTSHVSGSQAGEKRMNPQCYCL